MEIEQAISKIRELRELSLKIGSQESGYIDPASISIGLESTKKNFCPRCPIEKSCSIKSKAELIVKVQIPHHDLIYFSEEPRCKKRNPLCKNSDQKLEEALTTKHKSLIDNIFPWSEQNRQAEKKSRKAKTIYVGPGSKSKRKP